MVGGGGSCCYYTVLLLFFFPLSLVFGMGAWTDSLYFHPQMLRVLLDLITATTSSVSIASLY